MEHIVHCMESNEIKANAKIGVAMRCYLFRVYSSHLNMVDYIEDCSVCDTLSPVSSVILDGQGLRCGCHGNGLMRVFGNEFNDREDSASHRDHNLDGRQLFHVRFNLAHDICFFSF